LARLLEGKAVAEKIKEELRLRIRGLKQKPVLANVIVGSNAGAEAYARSQSKAAESLNIVYQLHQLGAGTSEEELIAFIRKLNSDSAVDGIIVQMPLPSGIDYKKISRYILPGKDVEGMHPENLGQLAFGKAALLPCTAAAVMELLKETGIDLYGKEAVVVGHSEIVGKPLALLLLEKFATVTVCHIGTADAGRLESHVRAAEVLVVAVGKAGLIKGDWVREDAVVIDVGINRLAGKIVGDVEFEAAQKRASWITPVPGGVGPLTVAMLMRNLVEAAETR
jgi:methylenetetrahydrofolate dehydrogenase (NADP+)/methenyltetrahydrofolate cyclohydrolase